MKKTPALLVLLLCAGLAQAQSLDLKDLLSFANYDAQKFDAHIGKKSFKRDYDSPRETPSTNNYYHIKRSKEGETIRKVSLQSLESAAQLRYQTSSKNEFEELRADMRNAGYNCYEKVLTEDKPMLFQKGTYSITTSIEKQDSIAFYTLLIEKADLPKAKEIVYAEDLIRFSSHEALSAFFGESNVAKDVFHYTETDVNQCSVLFPNSSREVIFIWNDEINYRKPAFLIIGGQMQTKGTAAYRMETVQNQWQTKQGIYSGMQLTELQRLNGGELSFYGWTTDRPGVLVPTSKGAIDFSQLSLVFNCMNCTEKGTQVSNIISSQNALADDRKIYISSLIILPEKTQSNTTALR